MNSSVLIIAIIVVAMIMAVIWLLLLRSSRRVNLTQTPADEQPEWMRSAPPPETTAATQVDGEGTTLYDYDPGENVAAPFAEQIEDILRAMLNADPYLRSQDYDIDLGTAPDGGLEIRVGNERYMEIEQIPDDRLRTAIQQAVAAYNQRSGK